MAVSWSILGLLIIVAAGLVVLGLAFGLIWWILGLGKNKDQ